MTSDSEGSKWADTLTPEQRSRLMSRVKGKDTKPEKTVRSLLHSLGYRFRLHRKNLPGSPDIVLPRYRTVVFVHGCFWHRHIGCAKATMPKSHVHYWHNKFAENVERDRLKEEALRQLGWRVIVVWQCQTRARRLGELALRLDQALHQEPDDAAPPNAEGTHTR